MQAVTPAWRRDCNNRASRYAREREIFSILRNLIEQSPGSGSDVCRRLLVVIATVVVRPALTARCYNDVEVQYRTTPVG